LAIALLEALFDLFEEHLDVPATAIEITYRARAPREVVGDEHACIKLGKMGEIHIGLVKNHDFTGCNACTDLAGALVVMLPSGIDDGKFPCRPQH